MLSASGPIRKAGGGGGGCVCVCAVHFRQNTKGGWGGCLAEEGEVPYMKGIYIE